jgi:hypothetical protein
MWESPPAGTSQATLARDEQPVKSYGSGREARRPLEHVDHPHPLAVRRIRLAVFEFPVSAH